MKRLSLEELKAQKNQKNVVENLEAVKGGNADGCHPCPKPKEGASDASFWFAVWSIARALQ